MQLDKWISDFLAKRGLQNPDGRPLFAYKTSHEEFESLGQLLRELPVSLCTQPRYSQAWLLFAAEWWKRCYAGGAWRWGPLCEAAGLKSVPYDKVRTLVITGHKIWCLQTTIKNKGKRFIGLVAVNGGLPMRLVESEQGGLSRLLRMVIEQALRHKLKDEQLRQAIEDQAALLPVCYQQAPVYELLENLVKAVLNIRKTYPLQGAQDPIAKLQQEYPEWEKDFPIALDSQAAASLIMGLVRDTVNITLQSRQPIFQIQRGLRFDSDDSTPVYETSFVMQGQAKRGLIAESLGWAEDRLPPQFQLLLRIGAREHLVGEALLRGDDYQLIARPLSPIHSLHDAAQLIVSRWGATLHTANLPGGEALSLDEPLIFEHAYPFARLIGQGDAVVKGTSALVVTPQNTIMHNEDGGDVKILATFANEQTLLELPLGRTLLVYRRHSFTVTVNPSAAQHPDAYWVGNTLEITSEPGLLLRGTPRLRIDQGAEYSSYAPQNELSAWVRSFGKNPGLPIAQAQGLGLCRLIWKHNDQRQLSTRAVILPADASIRYESGASPHEGIIHLVNWPDRPIRCTSEEIELKSHHDGAAATLKLKSLSTRPATSVSLGIQWPDGEQRITLPFPGYGVTLLRHDTALNPSHALTVEELIGCRAVLMSAQGAEKWRVRLTSSGSDARTTLSQEIPYTGIREIRLFELIPIIQQMLSCHSGLDQVVQLELVHAHKTLARLKVRRYSTQIHQDLQRGMASLSDDVRTLILDQSQAEGLLQALPLAEPDHDPISLPLHFSEQVFTGSWLVDLPTNIVGPWLLFTSLDSPLHSRPAIIPPTTSVFSKPLTPLKRALCEADAVVRMQLLRNVLHDMATKPEDEDWQTLELLLDRLHHLPLASLDVFKALTLEPQALAMATLLLDDFSSRLTERLPSELPFEWLLMAPSHWFEAFKTLRQQLTPNNTHPLAMIRHDIQNKSQFLSRWQPALRFIFDQGLHRYFEQQSQDVDLFIRDPAMLIKPWLADLFNGEKSAMQQMFRRNPADSCQYPSSPLKSFLQTQHGQNLLHLCKLPANDFKLPAVMLPFMAAFDTYAGAGLQWQTDPARLFSLRNARQFDTVWFDLAYECGLAMAQADTLKK